MDINPIKALLAPIERLIVEHGSAMIQEKHIALLKEQFSIAEREIAKLAAEKEILQSELETLKAKYQTLQNENVNLKQKIQSYDQSPHDHLLEKEKVDILLFLSEQSRMMTADSIASPLQINPQIALHHLTELSEKAMVLVSRRANAPPSWNLGDKGRKYLINNNLIS